MSYKGHLTKQKFSIKTDQFVAAWQATKNHGMRQDYLGTHVPRTLIEVLDNVGLRGEVDDDGNIVKLEWASDYNLYHLEDVLKDLAPFVVAGSLLRFHDETGGGTTYRFDGGNLQIEHFGDGDE